ncbi:hypothetical protein PG994_004170 [Apiospora phragmitis]|uniref:Uncharacterized protein n=1 Tax=Apiospora phragmitis TaxID=2905665 RepID=A0ABR1VPU6_9PEZI
MHELVYGGRDAAAVRWYLDTAPYALCPHRVTHDGGKVADNYGPVLEELCKPREERASRLMTRPLSQYKWLTCVRDGGRRRPRRLLTLHQVAAGADGGGDGSVGWSLPGLCALGGCGWCGVTWDAYPGPLEEAVGVGVEPSGGGRKKANSKNEEEKVWLTIFQSSYKAGSRWLAQADCAGSAAGDGGNGWRRQRWCQETSRTLYAVLCFEYTWSSLVDDTRVIIEWNAKPSS